MNVTRTAMSHSRMDTESTSSLEYSTFQEKQEKQTIKCWHATWKIRSRHRRSCNDAQPCELPHKTKKDGPEELPSGTQGRRVGWVFEILRNRRHSQWCSEKTITHGLLQRKMSTMTEGNNMGPALHNIMTATTPPPTRRRQEDSSCTPSRVQKLRLIGLFLLSPSPLLPSRYIVMGEHPVGSDVQCFRRQGQVTDNGWTHLQWVLSLWLSLGSKRGAGFMDCRCCSRKAIIRCT